MEFDLLDIEMINKTEGITLDSLGLSVRLYNCLKRAGYNTLTDVMLERPEKFSGIRNFGRLTEEELFALRNFVITSDRKTILQYSMNNTRLDLSKGDTSSDFIEEFTVLEKVLEEKISPSDVLFINNNDELCADIDLSELSFSARTLNGLLMNGIESLYQVITLQYSDLLKIKGFGQKCICELLEVIRDKVVVNRYRDNNANLEMLNEAIATVETYFAPILDSSIIETKRRELGAVIAQICEHSDDKMIWDAGKLAEIAKHNPINKLLRHEVMSFVPDKIYYGIDRKKLISDVSRGDFSFYALVDDIVESLIHDNQIRVISDKLCRYKMFLEEWIDTLEDGNKVAVELRCHGLTLEETGERMGVTRERVRQIVANTLRKHPQLYEDDYEEYIRNYFFLKDEYASLFMLNDIQVNYLLLSYKRGYGDVQSFLNDDFVPAFFKERVPAAFKGKVILLDGECIPLKREILIQKLLKLYFSDEECTIEEFTEFYMDFLNENDLNECESLMFPSRRALEARIADYPYTISKAGRKIRYYDIESLDIMALLDSMDLARYADMEISTLKLYREWPEVMEQYDIRDEYELHNLIRKKIGEVNRYDISVTRMPFIMLGVGDRNKQVEDLLLQLAPITNLDLAKEYEERYGVRSETVLANFFKCIDVYYHDGIFDLEQQELTSNEYAILKERLTEGLYLWDTVVRIYNEVSEHPNMEAINAMTLKKLGFRVYSQYVIKADYTTTDAFYAELLLKDSILDLNNLSRDVRMVPAYYTVLAGLRDSLELIEIEKDVFYRYDYFVEKYQIESKEEMLAWGEKIIAGLDTTEYFSIELIASENYGEITSRIGNNIYIINSILRAQPSIKTGKIANAYIGADKFNDLSQIGLITYLIETYGEMSTGALMELLRTEYKLKLEKSRVIYVIEGSDRLVYDAILDYVCYRAEWKAYDKNVCLSETRYAAKIEENIDAINNSDVLIAKIYWEDKYSAFVEYCGEQDCFKMKDILRLDFSALYDNASKLNISKRTIADVAKNFIDWVDNISSVSNDEPECESIMDLFFK